MMGLGRARLLDLVVWPAIAVLIGLGTWQAQRLGWKTELIASIEARSTAPAVDAPTGLTAAEVDARVVTPFETGDGRVVLVDRGWIPFGLEDPLFRDQGQVAGVVVLEGLLRARGQTNPFTPDNRPDKNVWYWVDPAAMALRAGIAPLPYFVEAGPAPNPGGLPIGGRPVVEISNNHLQYAITWYALAASLFVVYVIYRLAERGRAAGT